MRRRFPRINISPITTSFNSILHPVDSGRKMTAEKEASDALLKATKEASAESLKATKE